MKTDEIDMRNINADAGHLAVVNKRVADLALQIRTDLSEGLPSGQNVTVSTALFAILNVITIQLQAIHPNATASALAALSCQISGIIGQNAYDETMTESQYLLAAAEISKIERLSTRGQA